MLHPKHLLERVDFSYGSIYMTNVSKMRIYIEKHGKVKCEFCESYIQTCGLKKAHQQSKKCNNMQLVE